MKRARPERRGTIAWRMLRTDPTAKISDIAKQVGLSRSHVYRLAVQLKRRLPPITITGNSDLRDVAWMLEREDNRNYLNSRLCFMIHQDYAWLAERYGSGGRITVAQARKVPDWEWLRNPSFGPKSLAELRKIIGRNDKPRPITDDRQKGAP